MDDLLFSTVAAAASDSQLASLASRLTDRSACQQDRVGAAFALSRLLAARAEPPVLCINAVAQTVLAELRTAPTASVDETVVALVEVARPSGMVALAVVESVLLQLARADGVDNGSEDANDDDSGRMLRLLARLEAAPACHGTVPSGLVPAALHHLRSGSAETASEARRLLVTVFRGLESGDLKLQSDPELLALSPMVWTTVEAILQSETAAEHSKVASLAVWLQLVLSPSMMVGPARPESPLVSTLSSDAYWNRLRSCLLSGSDLRRKYGLALVVASATVVRPDPERRLIERFCTIFEAIVLGRYYNQAVDAVSQLASLNSVAADPSWLLTVLTASLGDGVQERHRTAVGSWVLCSASTIAGLFIPGKECPLAHSFLLDRFLPWAAQGSLFLDSLDSSHSMPVSQHGDQLVVFVRRFFACLDQSTATVVLYNLLVRLAAVDEAVFPMAVPYLVAGFGPTIKQLRSALPSDWLSHCFRLSNQHGLSPPAKTAMLELGSILGFADEEVSVDECVEEYSSLAAVLASVKSSSSQVFRGQGLATHVSIVYSLVGSTTVHDFTTFFPELLSCLWRQFVLRDCPKWGVAIIGVLLHPRTLDLAVSSIEVESLVRSSVAVLIPWSRSRLVFFNALTLHVRAAFISHGDMFVRLGLDDLVVAFFNDPPAPSTDAPFDQAIGQLPRRAFPDGNTPSHLDECFYHQRGIARLFDILNRSSTLGVEACRSILSRLLQPWIDVTHPAPAIVSKRRKTAQLQAIFILVEQTAGRLGLENPETEYLDLLRSEPLPKFRILLEWIVARIAHTTHSVSDRLLAMFEETTANRLVGVTKENPRFTVSLIRILTATAQLSSTAEKSVYAFVTCLLATVMSTKVAIRYESQWALLILLSLAPTKGWTSISKNTILTSATSYLHNLVAGDSAEDVARVAMMKKSGDFDLLSLFEGPFTSAQPIEPTVVRECDFVQIASELDKGAELKMAVPFSSRAFDLAPEWSPPALTLSEDRSAPVGTVPQNGLLQTKGTAWKTLLQSHSSTGVSSRRNSDLIVVGSLLTSATNIGGLTRAAEVLGAGKLYVHSLSVLSSSVFQSVAVTAELHLPIDECDRERGKLLSLLDTYRAKGYAIIGIEQTEASAILGAADCRFPDKVVFVLGNEHTGIPADVLVGIDSAVEIPQRGVIRSLNVQTAAAVVIAEYGRQRQERLNNGGL